MNVINALEKGKQEGLFDTLPSWAILLIGLGLLGAAAVLYVIDKKLDEEVFFLDIGSLLCGIGGVVAIWMGLFGSS